MLVRLESNSRPPASQPNAQQLSHRFAGVTVLAGFWVASLSPVFIVLSPVFYCFPFCSVSFPCFFLCRFSALQCLAKRRKMSATLSQFQYACIVICFPTCLLQVLLSYLVSRLSGKSFIVHGVNIQVNVITVDLNFSTAMF